MPNASVDKLLQNAENARSEVGATLHDRLSEAIYTDATLIADRAVDRPEQPRRFNLDRSIDSIVTSPIWGFPLMFVLLMGVFWLTIAGANIPSAWLSNLTTGMIYEALHNGAAAIAMPAWLSGLLIDGAYLAMAWVFSVMLPPMAIFFPLFTLLEDLGYLPRVAFNLDRLFKKVGAHGKQSLTMMMGWGCNAAGVVATRIIDSPRERLIAIITNNFSICNGRWPTLILMGTIFLGAVAPPALSSLVAAGSVVAITLLGVGVTLLVSAFLSRTWLKGEASAFSLELPPYRPPQVFQTLYTSVIDRTMIVLWRAMVMAAPAGALIWLLSNITIGNMSIAGYLVQWLEPLGWILGLNGIILLAYIVAIPANEIIIPTILMLTLTLGKSNLAQAGVMLELGDNQVQQILTGMGGWTALTAINLMLFSLLHNPCSTTILTIWNETKNLKWTAIATFLPLALGFAVVFLTTLIARTFGWA
jgi:ferrous iron transport protein B